MLKDVSLYVMATLYILAGVNHFIKPKFYLRIIPRYLPWHKTINYLSGLAEVLLGALLLVPGYTTIAGWGIIVLLIAVFPANVNHLNSSKAGGDIPVWLLYIRLPIQGILILWAWWHTHS